MKTDLLVLLMVVLLMAPYIWWEVRREAKLRQAAKAREVARLASAASAAPSLAAQALVDVIFKMFHL